MSFGWCAVAVLCLEQGHAACDSAGTRIDAAGAWLMEWVLHHNGAEKAMGSIHKYTGGEAQMEWAPKALRDVVLAMKSPDSFEQIR